jgi:hypothetical protein
MQSRAFPILLVCLAALLSAAPATSQTNTLQQQLARATRVRCTFSTVATGTWTDGAATAAVTPAKLAVAFTNVNADEGTADAEGTFGGSLVVVRYAVDYLHLMQTHSAGPLYTTTVLAKVTKEGRFLAVHTRHEYTDVRLPGFTSRPEMYVGDCEVEN